MRRGLIGWIVGGIGLLIALPIIGLAISARTTSRPQGLGVVNGRLAPCPDSPNCVSTQATDAAHSMPPIRYSMPTAQAKALLLTIIGAMPRVTIEQDTPTYLAAVFRSATFQFPDDVEFSFDESAGVIDFRSAARLGREDMGVNRARMAQISQDFATHAATTGSVAN